jgi:flagellum-specific peptidoglycan hydrolase FlgJ
MEEVRAKLREKLGDGPAADLLAAQIALETADGKYSYAYNVGNMKAADREGLKYQLLKTWEVEGGKRVDRREPFLAHESLDEGLQTYIEYLDRKGLLDVADGGDLEAYNAALKKAGYYTADEGQYGRNMRKRLDRWASEKKAPKTDG